MNKNRGLSLRRCATTKLALLNLMGWVFVFFCGGLGLLFNFWLKGINGYGVIIQFPTIFNYAACFFIAISLGAFCASYFMRRLETLYRGLSK